MNTTPQRRDQPADPQDPATLLPAPGHPVLAQDRHHVLREHLMAQITGETAQESSQESSSPRPARRRRLVVIAAPLALAAVVGLGVVAVDRAHHGSDGTGTGVVSAAEHRRAAQVLNRIALAAADRPAVPVRDDQFVYTEEQGSSTIWGGPNKPVKDASGKVTALKTYKGEVRSTEWERVDGRKSGLRRLVALSPDGTPAPSWQPQDMTMMGGGGYLNFRQLQALPTDPDALLKKLAGDSHAEKSRLTETVCENVGVILGEATLLPDLSSALYRAVAKLPDMRVVEHAQDGAGRAGIGLNCVPSPGVKRSKSATFVFDAKTLAYLGTPDSALLDVGVTDEKGTAPAGSSAS